MLLFECRIVSEYPVYIFVHHFNFEPDQINILTPLGYIRVKIVVFFFFFFHISLSALSLGTQRLVFEVKYGMWRNIIDDSLAIIVFWTTVPIC